MGTTTVRATLRARVRLFESENPAFPSKLRPVAPSGAVSAGLLGQSPRALRTSGPLRPDPTTMPAHGGGPEGLADPAPRDLRNLAQPVRRTTFVNAAALIRRFRQRSLSFCFYSRPIDSGFVLRVGTLIKFFHSANASWRDTRLLHSLVARDDAQHCAPWCRKLLAERGECPRSFGVPEQGIHKPMHDLQTSTEFSTMEGFFQTTPLSLSDI
jgi:hypothetical protein